MNLFEFIYSIYNITILYNMQNSNDNCDNSNDTNDNSNADNNNKEDNDVNLLSGNNKVDVEIEPDVKSNNVNMYVQLCSCSLIFHCFSNNKTPIT